MNIDNDVLFFIYSGIPENAVILRADTVHCVAQVRQLLH